MNRIRTNIQDGTYPPGYKLVTQDISDELGISRTPVVAAINRLVAEGLAESIPRKGTIVTQLTPKRIKDMCDVRLMMEVYAASFAVKNISDRPEVLEKMKSLSKYFDKIEDKDFDYSSVSDVDYEFHTLFVSLADNEQLLKMYQANWSIGTPYYVLRLANMPLSDLKKQFDAHLEFVQLLSNKDEAGLRKSLTKHISQVSKIIQGVLKDNPHILKGSP
ncbi:MAG: GntR family transcriptional regulator [Clostridia bacterium]|nr:GntR family transcriptional regulator [Clostridia bacterium]